MELNMSNPDQEYENPLPVRESSNVAPGPSILCEDKSHVDTQETAYMEETTDLRVVDRQLLNETGCDHSLSVYTQLCGTTDVAYQSTPVETNFEQSSVSLSDFHVQTPQAYPTLDSSIPAKETRTDPVAMVNKHRQDESQCKLLHKHTLSSSISQLVYDKSEQLSVREQTKTTLHVDTDVIAKRLSRLKCDEPDRSEGGSEVTLDAKQRTFMVKINPASNNDAEAELRKQIR